jgi:hypothetical protein
MEIYKFDAKWDIQYWNGSMNKFYLKYEHWIGINKNNKIKGLFIVSNIV